MELLLSGGGDPKDVVALDQFFVSRIDTQKPVLYIPVALERAAYAGALDWFSETYKPYGITHIEICTDLNLAPDLERFTAIFIGGGNTFKLLKEMQESGFDQKVVAYLKSDGFVYGGSAGSIIFGKSIKSAAYADENLVGLTDLAGLNMVGGRDIFCHYATKDDEFIRHYDNDLYVLYEASGLYVNGAEIEGIGQPYLNKNDITA